jgi:hypothetical protein
MGGRWGRLADASRSGPGRVISAAKRHQIPPPKAVVGTRRGDPAALLRRLSLVGPARWAHQEDRLARRDEALGAIGPEGGTRIVELERAELLLAEVALLAGGGLWLARHGGHLGKAVALP